VAHVTHAVAAPFTKPTHQLTGPKPALPTSRTGPDDRRSDDHDP